MSDDRCVIHIDGCGGCAVFVLCIVLICLAIKGCEVLGDYQKTIRPQVEQKK